jgi:hypothetical protein
MVFTSLVALTIYLSVVFFYQYIYPKKKIPYLILLIGLSILPTISIFRPGSYESGDLNIHITNTASFYRALTQGILIPTWAGKLNATYGYALFEFIYPLPYYLSSFFHFVGFNFLNSVKLTLTSSYIFSGIFMYLFLKNRVAKKYAFLGSVLYLFAPYHFVDLHFRADIGETLALATLPLAFYLVDKSLVKRSFLYQFLGAVAISLLILSHPAVSLLGFPILVLYAIFKSHKNITSIMKNLVSPLLGLLLSAFYWLPVLMEGKYTGQVHQIKSSLYFPKLTELLYSKWRFGLLFQGHRGEQSFALGYAHVIVIVVALYIILVKRIKNKNIIFFLGLFTVYLFLILEISTPIWSAVATLRKMQFPYRILTVLIFLSSALSAFVLEKINKESLYRFLIILAVLSSILNWGNRRNMPETTDKELIPNLPYSTASYAGVKLAMPSWIYGKEHWMKRVPENHIEAISGNLEILSEDRKIKKHEYLVRTTRNTIARENTFYFPGWELFVDGKAQQINYLDPNNKGIITFPLDRGVHNIVLAYTKTGVRFYSFLITVISLFVSGTILIIGAGLKKILFIDKLPTSTTTSTKTTAGKTSSTRKTRSTRPRRTS